VGIAERTCTICLLVFAAGHDAVASDWEWHLEIAAPDRLAREIRQGHGRDLLSALRDGPLAGSLPLFGQRGTRIMGMPPLHLLERVETAVVAGDGRGLRAAALRIDDEAAPRWWGLLRQRADRFVGDDAVIDDWRWRRRPTVLDLAPVHGPSVDLQPPVRAGGRGPDCLLHLEGGMFGERTSLALRIEEGVATAWWRWRPPLLAEPLDGELLRRVGDDVIAFFAANLAGGAEDPSWQVLRTMLPRLMGRLALTFPARLPETVRGDCLVLFTSGSHVPFLTLVLPDGDDLAGWVADVFDVRDLEVGRTTYAILGENSFWTVHREEGRWFFSQDRLALNRLLGKARQKAATHPVIDAALAGEGELLAIVGGDGDRLLAESVRRLPQTHDRLREDQRRQLGSDLRTLFPNLRDLPPWGVWCRRDGERYRWRAEGCLIPLAAIGCYGLRSAEWVREADRERAMTRMSQAWERLQPPRAGDEPVPLPAVWPAADRRPKLRDEPVRDAGPYRYLRPPLRSPLVHGHPELWPVLVADPGLTAGPGGPVLFADGFSAYDPTGRIWRRALVLNRAQRFVPLGPYAWRPVAHLIGRLREQQKTAAEESPELRHLPERIRIKIPER